MEAYLLGRFRVVVDGRTLPDDAWRRRKARQLFKLLLSRPQHRLTKDEAIELLWPDSDPDAAAINLRSAIHAIRRALGEPGREGSGGLIAADRDTLGIRPDTDLWVDADAFERAVLQARSAAEPTALLEQADALYAGDYLPDDLYDDWPTERREALKRLWTELQLALARDAERRGEPDRAAAALERLLRADPCDERAARDLMRLFARQGRRADAMRVYQRLVASLRDELGVEPTEETAQVERQLATAQGSGDGGRGSGVGEGCVSSSPDPRPLAPFVCAYPFPAPDCLLGRRAELARLQRTLERGRAGGQVVLLGATAGTGKSSLVGALVGLAREAGVLCLAGGCYEQEGLVPLGPFQDALADYLLARPPEQVRAELGSAAADLARVVPELRYHLDLPEPPHSEARSERMRQFGAVHACLRDLAERGTVLLCLEDLHAADAATLELLHYLARQTRRLPLVMIATFRTEEALTGRPLTQHLAALTRERLAEQITLTPLGHEDTAHLAAALLDGPVSDELVDSLFTTTEGNPLFVEQLVLALREGGRLEQREGVWHQRAMTDLAIPPVIREVVSQRLKRLSARCRETLAMAAVLGQTVPHHLLLESVEPSDERVLLADLEEAIDARLLHEMPAGYAFGHALLREAVYWSLSTPRRMLLHARAGETLERLAGPRATDLAAELAHHFVQAGHAAQIRAKALRYSLEAGRRAAALSSHREALAHFTRACELAERHGGTADLADLLAALEGRGFAEQELAMWVRAIESFRRVLELSSEPLQRARARDGVVYALHHLGDTTGALAEADAGLAELDTAGGGRDAAVARLRLQFEKAFLCFLPGRFREMLRIGEQMLPVAVEIDDPRSLTWAHSAIGGACMGLGVVDQGVDHWRHALAAAERANNSIMTALALENLGIQTYRGGRFAEAADYLERALALYRRSADERRAVNALQALGRVRLAEGDVERARGLAEMACSLAEQGQDRRAAECHDLLGSVQALRCEWEAAESRHEQALRIREGVRHAAGTVDSLIALGLLGQRRGEWTGAREHFARAVDVATTMDPSPQMVAAHRHLGRLLVRTGDEAEAVEQIERARALAETIAQSLEYPPTLLAVAEHHWRAGNAGEAARFAERALDLGMTAELTIEARFVFVAIDLLAGRLEQARPHVDVALELAERIGAPRLLGLAHLAAARVAAALRDVPAALASFEAAAAQLRAARTPYELGLALRDFGQLLSGAPDERGQARAMLDDALAAMQRVGARPAAARCEELLAALA